MGYFGENIQKFRERMKWSQEKLADKIVERMQAFGKELNYTNRSISMWENGDRLPSLEVMIAVSDLTGCSIDDLLKSDINDFRAKEKIVSLNRENKINENQSFIELSNSADTYFVDGDSVLTPYTKGQAKELFENLKNWRLNESEALNWPPYLIFDDKTLNNIVDIVPYKINLLWLVQGLGVSKIEKYGQKIVETAALFLKKYNVEKILYGKSAIDVSDKNESFLGCLGLLDYFGFEPRTIKPEILTLNEICEVSIIEDPITLTEFVSKFGLRTKQERQLRSAIMAWLYKENFIEEYKSPGGKISKVASSKGQDYGLITDKRVNAAGYTYYIVLYSKQAQSLIRDNINKIIENYNSTNESETFKTKED